MDARGLTAAAVVLALSAGQRTPAIHGSSATFIATGDPTDPPRIVADFNGWTGGYMTPSADGRTYQLEVTLDPAARIEYLIAYGDRFVLDPGNPLTVPAPAGPPRSELRMPGYRPTPALPAAREHGSLEELSLQDDGQTRRLRVYKPPHSGGTLPILYVYDGDIFFDALGLPSMLDSLISNHLMAPALVVMIDSLNRHDDYVPGSPFRDRFVKEIVPAVEEHFMPAADRRALLGLSQSTVGALDTCMHGGLRVFACALLAPAIDRKDFPAVLPAVSSDVRVLIETGTYDVPSIRDAQALRAELERRSVSVQYHESPEGHNHTAFRSRLPALLTALFPP